MLESDNGTFATLDFTGVCRIYDQISEASYDFSDPSYYMPCAFSFFEIGEASLINTGLC